jgi:hypothetical protein
MNKNPESRRVIFPSSILLSMFKRHDVRSCCTIPFFELSENAKASILNLISLNEDEIPVIIVYFSEDKWVLLTDERLFINQDSRLRCCMHSQMKKIDSQLSIGNSEGSNKKDEWSKMRVEMLDASKCVFEVESGASYFAFLSILQRICSKNIESTRS